MSKADYIEFCRGRRLPVFAQPWWLEAVSSERGKDWDAVVVRRDGCVMCAMAYHYIKRYGQRFLLNARLTPHAPILFSAETEANPALKDEVLGELCREIERRKFALANILFEKDFAATTAFERAGFQLKPRQTYVVEDFADEAAMLRRYHQMKRRQVLKAQKSLHVEIDTIGAEEFYAFYARCLQKRGLARRSKAEKVHYSQAFFVGMATSAQAHEAGKFFVIRDESGTIHAALFALYDAHFAYALVYAIDHEKRSSGASALMMHAAICHFGQRGLQFDFEGGRAENIGSSYAKFGTREVKYLSAQRGYGLVGICICKIFN